MAEVRARAGVPVVADFAGLGAPTLCAPIVVDTTTGIAYCLADGDVVTALGSAISGATGTFTTADAKTVTVTNGVVTAIA